jgi:glycosyltransferase involved in cell wall biosynthesis
MVPVKKLYSLTFGNRLKLLNYKFITHSRFIKNYLSQFGIPSILIYPYIDNDYIDLDINNLNKDKVILSVGRFFKHLHSKRQDLIIKLYKKIKQKDSLFKDFKLILAGGLKKEDNQYFNKLKNLAENDPNIVFKTNISHTELVSLYKKSLIYWHFTGFGVNENKYPEQVEHLGISPLEAMASGCMTFCYSAGGPKELITDEETGFLFQNEMELMEKTARILKNDGLQLKIRNNAKNYIKQYFSYEVFKNNVIKTFVI